jgi:hypothetical protein
MAPPAFGATLPGFVAPGFAPIDGAVAPVAAPGLAPIPEGLIGALTGIAGARDPTARCCALTGIVDITIMAIRTMGLSLLSIEHLYRTCYLYTTKVSTQATRL